jgi:5'-nucleotidase / UDP-sugar diphosphatase
MDLSFSDKIKQNGQAVMEKITPMKLFHKMDLPGKYGPLNENVTVKDTFVPSGEIPDDSDQPPVELTIIHTNDVHGNVTNFPVLGAKIEELREDNPNNLLLDAGDITGQHHTKGISIIPETLFAMKNRFTPPVEFMNHMEYDAMVTGNHDYQWDAKIFGGYDGPSNPDRVCNLKQLSENTNFPVLSANTDLKKNKPRSDEIKPYTIQEVDGVNVGVVGVVSNCLLPLTEWKRSDPIEALNTYIPEMKEEGADVVVALSHHSQGVNKKIASLVPDLDFIVGGHEHKVLEKPVFVEGPDGYTVPIVSTDNYGKHVGEVKLDIDPTSKKIADVSSQVHETKTSRKELDQEVIEIAYRWTRDKSDFPYEI